MADRQLACALPCTTAQFTEHRPELVSPILSQIERQRELGDELFLEQPRLGMRNPGHESVPPHPFRQSVFARPKRHALPAPDTAELDAERLRHERAQCQAERRSFGVAPEVVANPVYEPLATRRLAVRRRPAGRYPELEERVVA